MRRHLAVAVMIAAATLVLGGARAQESTATADAVPQDVVVPLSPALLQQRAAIEQQLATQHAQVEDLRQRVIEQQHAYEEQVSSLGSRAPTATFAPVATVPPTATMPPPA